MVGFSNSNLSIYINDVSQNGEYPRGGTLFAKILDFRLFERLKNAIYKPFWSPKLSMGS